MLGLVVVLAISGIGQRALPVLSENGATIASGVLLAPTIVLTAAHATEGLGAIASFVCGPDVTAGIVFKVDLANDLAMVELAFGCYAVPYTHLARHDLEEGDTVLVQGYPLGGPRRTVSGVMAGSEVIQWEQYLRDVDFLDAQIIGGNSGGPVLDATGRLVGIISARVCGGASDKVMPPVCYGLSIPLRTIRQFVE